MLGSIKYNLSNLLNFEGRDARQTFWYYVLFLVVLQFGIGIVAAIPMYVEMFTGAFETARSGVSEEAASAAMFSSMAGMMRTQMLVSLALGVASAGLFSAAFVRRLHDSGKPGWLLLLALVPYLGSLIYSAINFETVIELTEKVMNAQVPEEALADQMQLYLYSAFGWLGYIAVVVFGVMKSDDGPNEYGEEPVRF